jgi:hypothetical protein
MNECVSHTCVNCTHVHTVPTGRNAFLAHAGVRHGARRSALAMRMGVLWSAKRATTDRQPNAQLRTDSKCLLCQEDGGSHIASGCQHPTMEKMYTARHNAVGRQVLKCIRKGSMGGCIASADVGRKELCETDRVGWAEKNHVPESLLPRPTDVTEQAHTALQKLKPDVLLARPKNSTTNRVNDLRTVGHVEVQKYRCVARVRA